MLKTAFSFGLECGNYFGRYAARYAMERTEKEYEGQEINYQAHKMFRDFYEFAMAEFENIRFQHKRMNREPTKYFDSTYRDILPTIGINDYQNFDETYKEIKLHLDKVFVQCEKEFKMALGEILEFRTLQCWPQTETKRECQNKEEHLCLQNIAKRAQHFELKFGSTLSFIYHWWKHGQKFVLQQPGESIERITARHYIEAAQRVIKNENYVQQSKFGFHQFIAMDNEVNEIIDTTDDNYENPDLIDYVSEIDPKKHFVKVSNSDCSHCLLTYFITD
uniref:Uncharacterized protein n=1 Tax=Strigamia maritima TaxID=126957 RepID=T1JMT3_STRMM